MVEPEIFELVLERNTEWKQWAEVSLPLLQRYNINNIYRFSAFFAQACHESSNLRVLEENLNYSEAALLRTFSRYFGPGKRNAKEYAYKPEKTANYVYNDKYRSSPLGNIYEGDGWRFRGRGVHQITGRYNYNKFAESIGMSLESAEAYILTKTGALHSALLYWSSKNLNEIADRDDIVSVSRAINGGDIGLSARTALYTKIKRIVLNGINIQKPIYTEEPITQILQYGSRGESVKQLQKKLGLNADGVFGTNTRRAVQRFQLRNGLKADGIVGPATRAALW